LDFLDHYCKPFFGQRKARINWNPPQNNQLDVVNFDIQYFSFDFFDFYANEKYLLSTKARLFSTAGQSHWTTCFDLFSVYLKKQI
jgi:hypothetical protein